MKTKLTLSIDKDLIQFARHQAHSTGKSVSSIFSEYLIARKAEPEHLTVPKVSAMVGSLKEYAIDDSKIGIRKAYAKKYSH